MAGTVCHCHGVQVASCQEMEREEQCPASSAPWPEAAVVLGECKGRGQARKGRQWWWEDRGDSSEVGGFLTYMKGAGS